MKFDLSPGCKPCFEDPQSCGALALAACQRSERRECELALTSSTKIKENGGDGAVILDSQHEAVLVCPGPAPNGECRVEPFMALDPLAVD